MVASSCEMLALRFMGFRSIFVISKILLRFLFHIPQGKRPSLPQGGNTHPLTIIA